MAPSMATASPKGDGAVPAPILPQPQSALLRLPGEIRNKIYEYALAETRRLEVVGRPLQLCRKAKYRQIHHINELAQACRQLRLETADMGSAWNCVSSFFTKPIYASTPIRLIVHADLHGTCDFIKFGPAFLTFAVLCVNHPNLEVAFLTKSLNIGEKPRDLLVFGAALQLYLRGMRVSFKVDDWFTNRVDEKVAMIRREVHYKTFEDGSCFPPNFKVFPDKEYDESLIRNSRLGRMEGLEDRVAQIRNWFEQGI